MRIVGRLAGILEDELDSPASRDKFWHNARRKLGKLVIEPERAAVTAGMAAPAPASQSAR